MVLWWKRKIGDGSDFKNRTVPLFSIFSRSGLTLVEMLVTMSLLVLIAATVSATFSGGMRVWERLRGGPREQWTQVAFAQVRHDLQNLRRFAPIAFKGAYDEFSFPALVTAAPGTERRALEDAAEPVPELGRAGYFFDSSRKQLCRAQHPYRLLRRARLRDACSPVIMDVERVRFSYYAQERLTKGYAWSSHWSSEEPPLAVKLEIGYRDPLTRQSVTEALVFPVPLSPNPAAEG